MKPVDVMRHFWKNAPQSDSSKVLHVSAPRHIRTFFFPIAACCKETVSSHEVSQVFRRSENIFATFLEDTFFSTFASLAFAIGRTASAVDLLNSWKLFVSTFFVTCSCHGEKEMMSFFGSKRNS